jgi:hypothetical protein
MSLPPPGYQLFAPGLLRPDWHLPPGVQALVSTREGGASLPPWASFNLGSHVGDDALPGGRGVGVVLMAGIVRTAAALASEFQIKIRCNARV